MGRKQAILFVFLLFFLVREGKTQISFSITIKNYSDSAVLLTSYYGNKIKLVDTAYINEGRFNFNDKNYPPGIYILADPPKNKLFEFIINNENGFFIDVKSVSEGDIHIYNSRENELFFSLLGLQQSLFEKMNQMSNVKPMEDSINSSQPQTSQIDSIKSLIRAKELEIIQTYPQLFISKLIAARHETELPNSNVQDTLQKFLYLKNHFWNRMDLSDAGFLRTPLLDPMLNTYFSHYVYLHPDSTITAIDTVIAKARPSDEMVSYLLWYFISEYQNPKYMGFDKVFVHLVDNYFRKEKVVNATPSVLEKLKERSDKLKPLLIGETAPNLILIDTNGRFESFYKLENDYTLILFWDYECDICETEMEDIYSTLDTTIYDIGIYAANINSDLTQWKHSVKDRGPGWLHVNATKGVTQDYHELYDIKGTPRLFLLDKEKKIIAKNFKVAQLIAIIENQFMKSK